MGVAHRRRASPVSRLPVGGGTEVFRRALLRLKTISQESPATERGYPFACAVTRHAIDAYWTTLQEDGERWPVPALEWDQPWPAVGPRILRLAEEIGEIVARDEPVSAGFRIGEVYTALLPADFRARHGVFYTPPALTHRLLDLATTAGVDWTRAYALDPGCGGGAFLTPIALKILSSLNPRRPAAALDHISAHVRGFELDPFGAWMSQVVLESALIDLCRNAGRRLPPVVTVCDALAQEPAEERFDLVIGNPPYGRVTLEPEIRDRYRRSLHGHANVYGLFMDLGVRWARPGGVIAYVTPTGFLGGRYFKELRKLMAQEAPPAAIDLVTSRKGVFSDVLQETLLAAYRKGGEDRRADVHLISLQSETALEVSRVGSFALPCQPTEPWLIPRDHRQADLIERLRHMPHRLSDYGYKVSTGPLVWNRHKPQLHVHPVAGSVPILWAECITSDGRFQHRTEKKNHKPFLKPKKGQEWLLIDEPCVLVQRTTAKEQRRRLLAAELPARLLRKLGAVSVENHLNMVRPVVETPAVSLRVIAAILNSDIVDAAFRCISGSVAVSATELEALPLPPPASARRLEKLLEAGATREALQDHIRDLYMRDQKDVAARIAA
ncbi:MAG TPA: Eco57I restriction-modification methylase domain-containing protein [Thermoanaerobaculia bacterium]|jgi:adenine-specific DNA-methyltransferase